MKDWRYSVQKNYNTRNQMLFKCPIFLFFMIEFDLSGVFLNNDTQAKILK